MIPFFRKIILSAKDPFYGWTPDEDNVLYQSKILFSNLMISDKNVYNPMSFFASIKENGQIMPVNEQKDTDEFLNLYIDKIEQCIKGTDADL